MMKVTLTSVVPPKGTVYVIRASEAPQSRAYRIIVIDVDGLATMDSW